MADATLRKLQNVSGYPTLIDYNVCHVYERIPTDAERAPTHGKYQGIDQIHYFPEVLMSGQVPYPGDQVVVSGRMYSGNPAVYNVLQVRHNQLHGLHVTYGVNLGLSVNLFDNITIYRPMIGIDYLGDQIQTPNYLMSGVPASVQLISQEEKPLGAPVGTIRKFEVTLDREISFADGDMVLWATTTIDSSSTIELCNLVE